MNDGASTASSTETPRPARTSGHLRAIGAELVRAITAFIAAFGLACGFTITVGVAVLALAMTVLCFAGCGVDEGSAPAPDCEAVQLHWPDADSCSPTTAVCYEPNGGPVAYVGCILQDGPLKITCVSTCDGKSKP